MFNRSVRVIERLALLASDHELMGSNPDGDEIHGQLMAVRRFIAHNHTSQ